MIKEFCGEIRRVNSGERRVSVCEVGERLEISVECGVEVRGKIVGNR